MRSLLFNKGWMVR